MKEIYGDEINIQKTQIKVDHYLVPLVKKFIFDTKETYNSHIDSANNKSFGIDYNSKSYIFQQKGDFWIVVYQGKLTLKKDSKGMHYILYLLPYDRYILNSLLLCGHGCWS